MSIDSLLTIFAMQQQLHWLLPCCHVLNETTYVSALPVILILKISHEAAHLPPQTSWIDVNRKDSSILSGIFQKRQIACSRTDFLRRLNALRQFLKANSFKTQPFLAPLSYAHRPACWLNPDVFRVKVCQCSRSSASIFNEKLSSFAFGPFNG